MLRWQRSGPRKPCPGFPNPFLSAVLAAPCFPQRGAAATAPALSGRSTAQLSAHPRKARCEGRRGGVRTPPPGNTGRSRGACGSARSVGRGPGPRLSRKQVRVSAHPTATGGFRRCGVAGQGAGAFQGVAPGARPRGERDASETSPRRVPRRRGRPGGETPPAGHATARGDPGAARAAGGAGERRAPCTSCSVHAAFQRPALAQPASGPRRPSRPSSVPGTRRGGGTRRARPPAGRAAPGESPPELRAAELGAQLPGVRLCASSSLPSAPSRPEGGRAEFQARGWFILRPRILFTSELPHPRQIVHLGAGTGGLCSKSPCFPAPAFQVTSGNLWEELTGWPGWLCFAKGRKLCHPEGDLCHA